MGAMLALEKDPARRTLYVTAMLSAEAKLKDRGLIVVGGSAIEIYTRGAYVSDDIDVVGERERILQVLRSWGFKKEGRIWYRKDWQVVFDVPSSEYHGDFYRTRVISTPYGSVRLAAVEDLLVSRLISCKYWRIPDDLDHAVLLASEYQDSIDWEYVEARARQEGVVGLLPDVRSRMPPGSGERTGNPRE